MTKPSYRADMIANGPPCSYYTSLDRRPFYEQFGMRSLLAFFSNKFVRGGPKLLLHLALCLLGLIILTRYLPQKVSDVAFGQTYPNVWHWPGNPQNDEDDGSVGGGLRVVVFGENDIATPERATAEDRSQGSSWTEGLCTELKCSSYLSFVPIIQPPHRSLTSNALYATTVERILNTTMESESPGLDYSYLPEDYPVRWDLPDFNAQVSTFLSLPKPMRPPKETLWIFSFGTWDIWALAAMPKDVGIPMVDAMVADIFINVEKLYQASLDNSSIAWSDYHSKVAAAPNTGNLAARGGWFSQVREESSIEPFRILIPTLFDPSLIPGWQTERPGLPMVHSKAEQMRNAARLTDRWNGGIRNAMQAWARTPDPLLEEIEEAIEELDDVEWEGADRSNGEEDDEKDNNHRFVETLEAIQAARTKEAASGPPPNLSSRRRRRGEGRPPRDSPPVKPALSATSTSGATAEKIQYPQRDGIAYEMPDYLLDLICDRQMRTQGIKDSKGYGEIPTNVGFLDVTTPCVQELPKPSRGIPEIDEEELAEKEESKDDEASGSGKLTERRSETTICEAPQEHLFYTSFTLSQRAINEIAKQSAQLVRNNVTVRAFWEGVGKPAKNDEGWWKSG